MRDCTWNRPSGERLAGDGWDDYVKPFRTLEDVHVFAAVAPGCSAWAR